MPIKIPDELPAVKILNNENIFVMNEDRALHQDIRPLSIVILNLMPTKTTTETQLLRLLSNSPLQVDITLLYPETHLSRNTPEEYFIKYYETFENIKDKKFDGMIITGAPVEQVDFEEVDYWPELERIMDWSLHNVFSTLHICWGAQAGLYHHFNIPKYPLSKKIFGIFPHVTCKKDVMLLRGFDDIFFAPHSRHAEVRREDIENVNGLEILSESGESGVYIIATKGGRQIFITGHPEYDPNTLKSEYDRDVAKGLQIDVPKNYFPDNDPEKPPVVKWRSHSNLLFSNWLNYYVYQETPYNLNDIK